MVANEPELGWPRIGKRLSAFNVSLYLILLDLIRDSLRSSAAN